MRLKMLLLPLLLLTAAAPAMAATQCQGGTAIAGFRSARLGMTRAELIAATKRDFPNAPPPSEIASPDASIKPLQLVLLRLNPGPGAATVGYLFDAATDRLTQINIGWSVANPDDDGRLAIANAGARLQSFFKVSPPRGCSASDGGVVDPSTLVLFHADDAQGNFIELVAKGVRFSVGGSGDSAPAPTGPATLRLTYSAASGQP